MTIRIPISNLRDFLDAVAGMDEYTPIKMSMDERSGAEPVGGLIVIGPGPLGSLAEVWLLPREEDE